MEQKPSQTFPMSVEAAKDAELSYFAFHEKGVEGIGKAYDNLGREGTIELARAIAKRAEEKLDDQDSELSSNGLRRLEGYRLLPLTIEASFKLSDEFTSKTSQINEKPFVEAAVLALNKVHDFVSQAEDSGETTDDEYIVEVAQTVVADEVIIRNQTLHSILEKFDKPADEQPKAERSDTKKSPKKRRKRASEEEIKAQQEMIEKIMSDEPEPALTDDSQPLKTYAFEYRPEYMPPKSTVEKFDRRYMEPLARRIKASAPYLDDFLKEIDDKEDFEKLATVVKTAVGPITQEEAANLFERSDYYSYMLNFIQCGGSNKEVQKRLGRKMSQEEFITHVNRVNKAWQRIPVIAARAGYI